MQRIRTDIGGVFSTTVPAGWTTVDVDHRTLGVYRPYLTADSWNEGSDPTIVMVTAGGAATDNTGYTSGGPVKVPVFNLPGTLIFASILFAISLLFLRRRIRETG